MMTIQVPPATRQITVRVNERVCINCKHYEKYLREADVPGESYKRLLITGTGYCLLHDQHRGALQELRDKRKSPLLMAHRFKN